ncbi:hypothetical protein R6242_16120 [Iodobacter sp. CM08]|uniref:hypothetical protein n=1 Tax=Iodobacter sp. CM08 TaxID=3085902 RepID=UPI00298274A7|nr:hypothetical protein [Iodobacter sp. CM08]MDW5418093.1 hypothetical protein [Iodobacter sp. CM08]
MVTVITKKNTGKKKIATIAGDTYYVPVVDGNETNLIAETEDVALLLGLGLKYDGLNSPFAKMATRMLKIETKWAE